MQGDNPHPLILGQPLEGTEVSQLLHYILYRPPSLSTSPSWVGQPQEVLLLIPIHAQPTASLYRSISSRVITKE